MKPETNLFLRSLIGKEKARLCAEKTRIVSNNCAQSPASLRLPPEDVDKIIQIDRDAKKLNSALSELREEAEKQAPLGENAQDDAPITNPVEAPTETQAEKPKITRPTKEDQILFILRALISYHERMTMKESTPYDIYLESLRFAYQAAEEKIAAAPAPRLSDETANHIRKALGLYVDTLRKAAASVGDLLQLLPDDKKLIQARFDAFRLIEQARQDLNEFNEAYPRKGGKAMNTIPSLSPETIEIIRNSLEIHKDSAELLSVAFAEFASGEEKKDLEANVSSAHRALDEFNAVYPEDVRK